VTGGNAETDRSKNPIQPTSKASGAIAGFLRLRYRFLEGRFHPYLQANIGGGEIRHALDISGGEGPNYALVDVYSAGQWNNSPPGMRTMLNQEVCPNHANCVDTIALGYFFVGGGAGLWYDVASHFGLILDVNLIGAIGTGDHQSGFNIDVSAGVGAHFL
jgi:hypothetical protein